MKIYGSTYTIEQIENNLTMAKENLLRLDRKEVAPSRIVGKGYINPRKQAYEYLNRQIGMYTILVDLMKEEK